MATPMRRASGLLPELMPPRDAQTVLACCETTAADCSVLEWAASGAMELTGPEDGPPTAPNAPVAARVAAQARRLETLTGRWGRPVPVRLAGLLGARAAESGRSRHGRASVNERARLLRGRDGWCAITLARPEDVEMVSIIIGTRLDADEVWPAVAAWVADRSVSAVVAALQELSVPSSILGGCAHTQAVRTTRYGASARTKRVPVVADLSALWAGPLAARLLSRAGAQLVTVEDVNRPDGARRGPAQFYHDLHTDAAVLRLDLQSRAGRAALLSLVRDADIVIEASRPRALRRMGLVAEDLIAERPGRTWVSITGYGREAFDGNRVAFGDDAAVAGGLVGFDATGGPVFCADAVADPLTGLRAAIAVVSSQLAGGGHLIDVAMAGVSAEVAQPGGGSTVAHPITRTADGRWAVSHEGVGHRLVAPPRQGRPW